jgi:hypothetical protein
MVRKKKRKSEVIKEEGELVKASESEDKTAEGIK